MKGVYLLFCWAAYESDGGFGDLLEVFETIEEAKAAADRLIERDSFLDRFEIISLLDPSENSLLRGNGQWVAGHGGGPAHKLAAILAKLQIEGATAPATISNNKKGGRL